MTEPTQAWDGALVRAWLERRFAAAQRDQDSADKRGYGHEDDYDKALAEAWVCLAARRGDAADDRTLFAARLKALLDQDEYRQAGVHDERRFEREVRSCIRKLARMTKTNTGFDNKLHYQ